MVAGEDLPDRFREGAGEVDLRDLGAALFAESVFGVLVALAVVGAGGGVLSGFDQRPAEVFGACLESGPRRSLSPDCLTRGHRPVYPTRCLGV